MNKSIVASGLIITASGVVNAWTTSKPITPVVIGGYVFVLLMAILDVFGGDISKLASALSMLAVAYVVIDVFPWSQLLSLISGGQKTS